MRKLGCLTLLIVLTAVIGFFGVLHVWSGRGPLPRNITLTVAAGSSLSTASEQLEKQGAIASASRFRILAKVLGEGTPIKAGEYRIPAHLSQADILKLLQGGRTLQRFVTVPEGWPSVLVHDALAKATELTGDAPTPVEGTVLPDSYSYERGDTRASMVKRMQDAMTRYLAAAWTKRAPGIVVKTPREALILASIVEKETGKPSERRLVAAVYSNRLKRGMMLQADPTIIYPITKGRPLGRRILLSEVHAVNAYNTYAMTGLPAGPICNPGRASIDAVLNPEASNALYFVADGSGGHVFADTLDQHNANVAKWREYRRVHGI
ncbi:endolytic transglycosylase MltG [Sphingomonas immobilis]|uniref:Endolytic murein transglycosylase n=1 Tax=Sphingomonas immobilis TaxID=3063997 RepID=A0ABT9A5T1_9SPHN|nr:endolytic transglycosylase MltG [Sphingomonas sp. CA1-15]MDO7844341.1 endolytic transglycosylase MltG [Sphingomonas sp. CA1-15]